MKEIFFTDTIIYYVEVHTYNCIRGKIMYSTVQCVIQVLREALLLKHSVMFATCTSMSAVNVLKCVGVGERILRKRVTIKVRI